METTNQIPNQISEIEVTEPSITPIYIDVTTPVSHKLISILSQYMISQAIILRNENEIVLIDVHVNKDGKVVINVFQRGRMVGRKLSQVITWI